MSQRYEELSKYAFGSTHMLAVMLEISKAADGQFYVATLIENTGLPSSSVHAVLTRLKRAGLIRRTGTITGDKIAIYERRAHPFWNLAEVFDAEVKQLGPLPLTDVWQQEDRTA